jgi:RHH-type proline utilization regulon transcriptional repressor/proline dehydrogenase/delta 1-pyrroline-5-carboxylate dehydrogenase
MTVRTLAEAITVQNGVEYGLTAGIHSLDPNEVSYWLERVEAGNCYVNRGVTGAIVQRQPFGGWKKSSVGAGAKAGGPNYLFGLGEWVRPEPTGSVDESTIDKALVALAAEASAGHQERYEFLLRSLASDKQALETVFGVSVDWTGLAVERNVFRYTPADVVIRASGFVPVTDIVRVFLAGSQVGARMRLSVSEALPEPVSSMIRLGGLGVVDEYVVESERQFVSRVGENLPSRIRLIGGRADAIYVALDGAPEVAIYADEVTESGRVEILPFVKEQAVSVTAHRFGAPDPRFLTLKV